MNLKFAISTLCIPLLLAACEKQTEAELPEPPAEPVKKKVAVRDEPDPFEDYNTEVMIEEALIRADENRTAFLETDYEPLTTWLNERFEIKYRFMEPGIIFDQVPLNDIHYELKNMPKSPPQFEFSSVNVSRRELLSAIAKKWNLKMTYKLDESGIPSGVIVTGQ